MSWPLRTDMMCPWSGTPEKSEIAEQIEDLVAHELVGEAQRAFRCDLVVLDDHGVARRAALDHPGVLQRLHVPMEDEGPRRRDLLRERLRGDLEAPVLGADETVVVLDREGEPEAVMRKATIWIPLSRVADRIA